MERTVIIIVPLAIALVVSALVAWQADADDELLLAQSTLHLDYKADKTGWPSVVMDQIKNEFSVSEERIYGLREQGFTYGEISTLLSLAEQMPGGITDKNVQKIVRMRQGGGYPIGWGSVSKALGVKMSRAVDHNESINEAAWTGRAGTLPKTELEDKDVRHNRWSDLQMATPGLQDGLKPGN